MNIVEVSIKEIIPYEKNPRNNKNAIDKVCNSIKEFGFKVPLVIDKDNIIVTGHTRFEAAKKLKLKTLPCVIADDLSDEQIKAFRIADNKVAEFATWDFDLLESELKDILEIDMSDFGIDLSFLDEDKEEGETLLLENKPNSYKLIFTNEYEEDKWNQFIDYLSSKYPSADSIAHAIAKFVEELNI